MATDPAGAVLLGSVAFVALVAASVAANIAFAKARVADDVRRHGGRVASIRTINVLARGLGFHVEVVDAGGRRHQARAYPRWGKVFWRGRDQPLTVLNALSGTVLDAEWWRTPCSGPPGPLPRQWLPGDSPPTVRRNRLWWIPIAFGAFFLVGAAQSLSAFAMVALASGSWLPLVPSAVAAVAGVGLVVLGVRVRR